METSKARERRLSEGFFDYCNGDGIDIGCEWDPLLPDIDKWDRCFGHGDAMWMAGVKDERYDYVYSSHCLEHIIDPVLALTNWFRILKPNGLLLLYLPHRDLYEKKKTLPSNWNPDHKFFILPDRNDPPHTWGLKQLIEMTGVQHDIIYINPCNYGNTITEPFLHSDGEFSIEAVIRKIK